MDKIIEEKMLEIARDSMDANFSPKKKFTKEELIEELVRRNIIPNSDDFFGKVKANLFFYYVRFNFFSFDYGYVRLHKPGDLYEWLRFDVWD